MLSGWCMEDSGRSFNHLIQTPYNKQKYYWRRHVSR